MCSSIVCVTTTLCVGVCPKGACPLLAFACRTHSRVSPLPLPPPLFARRCQLDGKWQTLGDLSKDLASVPMEFLPPCTRHELLVAQHEFENITIVTECSRAVEFGCVTGSPGLLNVRVGVVCCDWLW